MKRYTQLEMEVLKAAGYSVKEIAHLDAAPHSYCEIFSEEGAKEYGFTDKDGKEVEYNGKKYIAVWMG